jgi:hypothetical protein
MRRAFSTRCGAFGDGFVRRDLMRFAYDDRALAILRLSRAK